QSVGVCVTDSVRPYVGNDDEACPGRHPSDLHPDPRLGRTPQPNQGHATILNDGADLVHGRGLGLAKATPAGVFRNIAEDVGIAGNAFVVGAALVAQSRRVDPEESSKVVSEGIVVRSEDLAGVERAPAA